MNGTGVDPALEMEVLRAENTRLIALLEAQGIEWRAGVCEKPRIKWGLRESAADPAFRRRDL